MKLDFLSFSGDRAWDRRIKEETNYQDASHIYTATYATAQLVLSELGPIDLDGNCRHTVCLNIDHEMRGKPGYNWSAKPILPYSFYNLGEEPSRKLYAFREFGRDFQRYAAGLLLDALAEADEAQGGRNRVRERREEVLRALEGCGWEKKLLLEKFSKADRGRKHAAKVYRCLSQEVGEAIRAELVERSSGEVLAAGWMTPVPGYVQRVPLIKRAWWEGRRFFMVMGSLSAAPVGVALPE